ncbi:hypothetical protein KL918_000587 [Ogataea parapolymorpha]|nr:hypothetical protein KL916_005428 [Ogataea parapolymorpha]KAG7870383.1 hypothetical protein KL918_000587 [Ogataea parapolymorpha]
MSHNSSDLDKIETKSVANLETVSLSAPGSSNDLFGVDDSQLHRSLKDRHIGMIALVSVFGTGLFLSSGGTLAKTGPVGMLIAYAIIGVVVGLNQLAMAETAALAPLTGASIRHAEIFIDEAVGFALGYLKLWQNLLPGGVVSAALVIQYWSDLSPAVWITVLAVPIAVTNLFSIRIYGEVEFVFGMLKICLIVMLVLAGLVLDLGGVKGQERLGFHYWKDPGPFAAFIESGAVGRFVGFWAALSSVVYSYGGVQGIALLAGETKNPRTNIPKAAKRILYRVRGELGADPVFAGVEGPGAAGVPAQQRAAAGAVCRGVGGAGAAGAGVHVRGQHGGDGVQLVPEHHVVGAAAGLDCDCGEPHPDEQGAGGAGVHAGGAAVPQPGCAGRGVGVAGGVGGAAGDRRVHDVSAGPLEHVDAGVCVLLAGAVCGAVRGVEGCARDAAGAAGGGVHWCAAGGLPDEAGGGGARDGEAGEAGS